MATDIIYIIDKIREDNLIKYGCLEPYISSIINKLDKGSFKLNNIEKKFNNPLLREEYLQLMSYLFYGCICITRETSTIAPAISESLEKIVEINEKRGGRLIKMNKWLTNIETFGATSKQGDVYKGYFLGKEVVLKRPKKSFFLENTLKDYFNGIRCVNSLRMECPMFAYTLGILTIATPSVVKTLKNKNGTNVTTNTNKSTDEIWLVTEYIKGKTLKEMLKDARDELSFKDFLDIFAQILVALEIGQHKHKFCHYDLHTDNVIIVPTSDSYVCHTFLYDVTIKPKYMPVLIDYGMSSISPEKNIFIGQHKIEKNGIFPYLFPGYDAYIFLLFCRDVASVNIRAGIDHLFRFYGDIDHSNYVTTLKNNTGRQTPLFFLEFIRKNYPQLSLQFTPRTVMNKALLFRTPSMMMAEMFLDEDEKSKIESCFDTQLTKGFIYFMLECTRNQLWFGKDKNALTMTVYKKMMAQDMTLLEKFLKPFNITDSNHRGNNNHSNDSNHSNHTNTYSDHDIQKMDDLQCAVNLLFLIRQLKMYDFRPYREWVDKFEGSDMYMWYKNKKPYFDRCQRLK
jgi:serine/threonine protein kinase